MLPFNLRYSRTLAVLLLILGLALLGIGLATSKWTSVFPGVVLPIVGALMLVNPMLRFEPHEVQVRNLLGMTLKRYPVNGPGYVRIDGKGLYYAPTGKKIATLGFGVDSGDANRVRALLGLPPA